VKVAWNSRKPWKPWYRLRCYLTITGELRWFTQLGKKTSDACETSAEAIRRAPR